MANGSSSSRDGGPIITGKPRVRRDGKPGERYGKRPTGRRRPIDDGTERDFHPRPTNANTFDGRDAVGFLCDEFRVDATPRNPFGF